MPLVLSSTKSKGGTWIYYSLKTGNKKTDFKYT